MSEENKTEKEQATNTQDQVALEMMKFIAVATGYGKGSNPAAGFGGKTGVKTPEEHAEALMDLFKIGRAHV